MTTVRAIVLPTREDAIVALVREAIGTGCSVVRLDCQPTIDLVPIRSELLATTKARFALTAPFSRETLGGSDRNVASDPAAATRWRNEPASERAKRPLVVLGRAKGRAEAGLRDCPVVIDEGDILKRYGALGRRALSDALGDARSPIGFFEALVESASAFDIDADALSTFVREFFADSRDAHSRPQSELWRLGLFPDREAQDPGKQRARLAINLEAVQFLRRVAATKAEEARLSMLKQVADEGSAVASAALAFRKSGKGVDLKGVELAEFLDLGSRDKVRREKKSESVDLLEAFDAVRGGAVETMLRAVAENWDLESLKPLDVVAEGSDFQTVAFEASPRLDTLELRGGIGEQILYRFAAPEHEGKAGYGSDLIDAAHFASLQTHDLRFTDGARELLECRGRIWQVQRWGARLLELLASHADVLEACESYLSAWGSLADLTLASATPALVSRLRQMMQAMDADWDLDDRGIPNACELYSIHPYVLDPYARLARQLRDDMSGEARGSRAAWVLDKVVPAYPAIWSNDSTLIFESGGTAPRFRTRVARQRPGVDSAHGLEQVLRSYIGLHPYARRSLSVILVDPPPGQGVARGISAMAKNVDRLFVEVVLSEGTSVDSSFSSLPITRLTRVDSISAWAAASGTKANVVFLFSPARPGHIGVHHGGLQPSAGVHNVLTVAVTAGSLFTAAGESGETVPYVSLQPRQANETVGRMMKLSRPNPLVEDTFFQTEPLLKREELSALDELTGLGDWLVVGAPSPIGLVPPRDLPHARYVGREDFGSYGLFIFAQDMFAVRKKITQSLSLAAIQPNPDLLEAQLENLARRVPCGVLHLGRSHQSVTPHIGLMVAASLAVRLADSSRYFHFFLSVDALGWTNYWLGGSRCDLLLVSVAREPGLIPRVKITAIESKSVEGPDVIGTSPGIEPFKKGIDQVGKTLASLETIMSAADGASLTGDAKLAVLFEHLVSECLGQLAPIRNEEREKLFVLESLNELSARRLEPGLGLQFDGLVSVTHRDITFETRFAECRTSCEGREWKVLLASCGVVELRKMFEASLVEGQGSEPPTKTNASVRPEPLLGAAQIHRADVAQKSKESMTERVRPEEWIGAEERQLAEVAEESTVQPEAEPLASAFDSAPRESSEAEAAARSLESVCRARGFPVSDVALDEVRIGPTLVSVPVELRAGSSIRPIQAAEEDLARELGVSHVTVENEPDRPFHVRFLVPRREREFPPLPAGGIALADERNEHYLGLWLGAEVDGSPHRSFVSQWPHLLVAGTTGSGKTTFMRTLLHQLDLTDPGEVSLVIVDGKGEYDYLDQVSPERFAPQFPRVLLGYEQAPEVLRWVVEEEIPRRRAAMAEYYRENRGAPKNPRVAYLEARVGRIRSVPIAPLVVLVDEFAEIMLGAGSGARDFEDLVQRLVQTGRSTLVHLILVTQRPDAKVLRGAIKANISSRIALAMPTHHDSMTVLGETGAEHLLGSGDMYFWSGTGRRVRLQAYNPGN